ncbi:MAG TPA: PDGLE domain-containing protein [Dissulfurispiraceae bacterium]|nr:PDGLE domain-containing protein [Dissulfurispiraceae bacterium]
MTAFQKKLWTGLVVMALLSPIGIFLPKFFGAEDAWGEWSAAKLKELIGYIPAGLEKLAALWKAPIPDYNPGGEDAALGIQVVWYVVSGLLGILLVAGVVYLLAKLSKKDEK